MKFHIVEIKSLGYGLSRRLSLRLEKSDDPNQAQAGGEPPLAVYTIHAVVPFNPEYGPVQIGQEFELVPSSSNITPANPDEFDVSEHVVRKYTKK